MYRDLLSPNGRKNRFLRYSGQTGGALCFVPRHGGSAHVELAVEPEVVEVGQVMSRGEMLEKLVARSPTAAIGIGGVL